MLVFLVRLGGYIVNLLLFLQTHRETDHFFTESGVQLVQHDRDQFNFRHMVFTPQFKNRVDLVLVKVWFYVLHLIWMGHPSHLNHTLTHHTRKLLVY